jgi:hypothetical protein
MMVRTAQKLMSFFTCTSFVVREEADHSVMYMLMRTGFIQVRPCNAKRDGSVGNLVLRRRQANCLLMCFTGSDVFHMSPGKTLQLSGDHPPPPEAVEDDAHLASDHELVKCPEYEIPGTERP